MPRPPKKLDPIRGWDVVITRTPAGRPIIRATDPDGGRRDWIETTYNETEDGLLLSLEATERAILFEMVRRAPENKKAKAQKELETFIGELIVTRGSRSLKLALKNQAERA
jgi:hypothetical protein